MFFECDQCGKTIESLKDMEGRSCDACKVGTLQEIIDLQEVADHWGFDLKTAKPERGPLEIITVNHT